MVTAHLGAFLRTLTREAAAEAMSDRQLVEAALAGPDEAVFRALVQRHGGMVYRVCRRVLRHEQDAEDAFQATFLILAGKLGSVRKLASLASWLHGVAHRVALRARDRNSTRRRHERGGAVAESRYPDDMSWGDVCDALHVELHRLPEKWRAPLILCYLEGRTQDEAARQLGWSKGTLRNRLEEARAALGRRLARRGLAWSAALFAALLSDATAPAVPPDLISPTAGAATRIATGQPAGGVASDGAVGLTEEMVKPMFLTKLNAVTVSLFISGLLTFGTESLPRNPDGAAQAGQPGPVRGRATAPQLRPGTGPARVGRGVPFEPPRQEPVLTTLGPKAFRNGDVIEITGVRATSPKLEQGDSVTVRGRVRLASRGEAQLGLYLTQTTGNSAEETDPAQTTSVKRGLTEFEVRATIKHRGVLHLTLYDEAGKPFGGVYFGTQAQMKRIEDWSLGYYLTGAAATTP